MSRRKEKLVPREDTNANPEREKVERIKEYVSGLSRKDQQTYKPPNTPLYTLNKEDFRGKNLVKFKRRVEKAGNAAKGRILKETKIKEQVERKHKEKIEKMQQMYIELQAKYDEMQQKITELAQREEQLQHKNSELAQREEQLQHKNAELAQREEQLGEKGILVKYLLSQLVGCMKAISEEGNILPNRALIDQKFDEIQNDQKTDCKLYDNGNTWPRLNNSSDPFGYIIMPRHAQD